ncbi:SOS response-associated peptidase family protein [Phenylobacterium sp.]|uniref:SOS response-associated peptidase n=1 Tax=Phenylobacterium sp. TaxID=1871053 RepID=UPI0025D66CDB|nr:SOS response-associated peptidase family protein [Phenylobacterium sp.]
MCNLYSNNASLPDLVRQFQELLGLDLVLSAGDATLANQPWATESVWPRYQGLFVRPIDPANPSAGLEPAVGRWGVVPFFHKGPAKDWKAATNNCRSEEMHEKATFRQILKEKRCIIPATHFVEHTGPKGRMTKHAISPADGSPLFLAGLWARHTWQGETTESYTMLMQGVTDACDMVRFHDRQPVFLDRESARIWLDLSADYRSVLKPPGSRVLAFDPPEPVAA